jgi:hypothetical protein
MLKLHGSTGEVRIFVGLGALIGGLLFASLRRGWARMAVPVAIAAFLLVSSQSVFGQVHDLSAATRYAGNAPKGHNPSWIDRAVGRNARVEVIYTADILDPHVVWQAEFWNRSVHRVFGLTAQDPSIPDVTAKLEPDARITPILPAGSPDLHPGYVAGDSNLDIDGDRIAKSGQLALWRVHQPLRLRSLTSGITRDGWTGAAASYTRFVVPPGATQVVVRIKRPGVPASLPPARVAATVGPLGKSSIWAAKTVTFRGKSVLRLPFRRAPFQVRLAVSPTFSPAMFGSRDTRTLGVVVSFRVR